MCTTNQKLDVLQPAFAAAPFFFSLSLSKIQEKEKSPPFSIFYGGAGFIQYMSVENYSYRQSPRRLVWIFFSQALTFIIPNFILHFVGDLKTPGKYIEMFNNL